LTEHPREVVLYHTLGQLLTAWEPPRWAEAVECYEAARVERPDLGANLATALLRSGRGHEAEELLGRLMSRESVVPRRLWSKTPTNPYLRFQQANTFYARGKLFRAKMVYYEALALDPKLSAAHNNLGNTLYGMGRLDEAMAEYRLALALDPKLARAHYNLGNALRDKGDLDGAITCYQKALELDPKFAQAPCNLGLVLLRQGRFAEAVASLRHGHELGSKRPGWSPPSAQWVRDAESFAALAPKVPPILQGEETAASPGEGVILAKMCQEKKKRYVASARLYADAFAAEPKLAADFDEQHRYHAACSAALAAAGQGEDATKLDDKERVRLRRQALDWLRDELTTYAEPSIPYISRYIQPRLAPWRQDPDLASLRDPQALDRLPENERAPWRALWRDVDELLKKAEPTQGRKEP
jgi:hypothetical protein